MPYLLHQLLRDSAEQDPGQDAVLFKEQRITYQALEMMSNQLAYSLRSNGIEKGDRIGIYLDKSIEAVVAIHGILKAGAIYVPLDPDAPAKRVGFIINNCGMKGLVSTQTKIVKLNQPLSNFQALRCLILTDSSPLQVDQILTAIKIVSWTEILQLPSNPLSNVHTIEDDLAYILYTSGSTGNPKGVMISHRTALTFVNWAHDRFQVQAADRVSNHAPLHFDLSIFDIFSTIKVGGTVILVPKTLSVFPIQLAQFIEEQRISIWYSVPSILTKLALFGSLDRYEFSNLRTILFAGEVFPIKYLRMLKDLIPHPEYYNLYGPTETNVCTYYRVEDIPPDRVDPFPIGKACENCEVFALNDQGEIAAPGQVGELYVRGPGLMQGYWGLPERTAQGLTPHPTNQLWAETVYRTGDLVKQDQDGNYLFLGRRDNQIKSRGYRIELGEIETALYCHPQVEEAAVIAIPDEEISHIIKAVVVPRNGTKLTKSDLEAFCAARIPHYMIPGFIEFQMALPKTSTGKIDKVSLVKDHLAGHS